MCKCCIGDIPNEACGLPKGTIRSVISLIVVVFGIVSLSTLMILLYVDHKYEAAIGVGSTIGSIIGIVIGYYFGSRSAEGAAQMISNTEQQLIKIREDEIRENRESRERSLQSQQLLQGEERNGRSGRSGRHQRSRPPSKRRMESNVNREDVPLEEIAVEL